MAIANEQMTNRMSQLFEQARRYLTLQKDYLSLNSVEILSRLFSAVALVTIFILIGFTVLLFGSFALAYWIGELLGSIILGFVVIAAVQCLCILLVYANRKAWIVEPTTRFMVGLLTPNMPHPSSEGIALEKEHVREQLNTYEDEIKTTSNSLLSPLPQARTRWENASNLLHNGMAVFRGLQLALSAVAAARRVFGIGRKKKK